MRLAELDRRNVTRAQIQNTDEYQKLCQSNGEGHVLTACILFLRGDFRSLDDALAQAKLQMEVAHTAGRELVSRPATMKWVPSGPVAEMGIPTNNSFVNLIAGSGDVNLRDGSAAMNCWEAVIVAAILNGSIVNPDKLRYLYDDNPRGFTTTLVQRLRTQAHSYNQGRLLSRPVMGDVVMFSKLDHVVLATGKHTVGPTPPGRPDQAAGTHVISFWPAPERRDFGPGTVATVNEFTVEGICTWMEEKRMHGEVTFGCPDWEALK